MEKLPTFPEMGERVKKLYDSGKSRDEIASELKISSGSVRIYGYAVGIDWHKKQSSRKNGHNKKLEEITSESNNSNSSRDNLISNGLEEMSSGFVNSYSKNAETESSENIHQESQIVSEIKNAIADGANSIKSIMEKTTYSYNTIKKYATDAEIELPKRGRLSKVKDSDLDSMLEQGLNLQEIGEFYGVSRERARQIIQARGKTEVFRMNRHMQTNSFKEGERKKVLGEILGCLTERINELAEKESWAYKKAIEYLERPRQNLGSRLVTHSFDDVLEIFEKYENAQKTGQKISLQKLSEGTSYHFVQVGKLLSSVGVSPMHGDKWKGRTPTSKNKKEAIRRSLDLEIPSVDIAYFLGIPSYVIENNISQMGLREKRQKSIKSIKQFGSEGNRVLSYRLASEIYEAGDKCKFSPQETAEVLDIPLKIVKHAIEYRREIEPVILNSLRVIYNDSEIQEPYKKSDF